MTHVNLFNAAISGEPSDLLSSPSGTIQAPLKPRQNNRGPNDGSHLDRRQTPIPYPTATEICPGLPPSCIGVAQYDCQEKYLTLKKDNYMMIFGPGAVSGVWCAWRRPGVWVGPWPKLSPLFYVVLKFWANVVPQSARSWPTE